MFVCVPHMCACIFGCSIGARSRRSLACAQSFAFAHDHDYEARKSDDDMHCVGAASCAHGIESASAWLQRVTHTIRRFISVRTTALHERSASRSFFAYSYSSSSSSSINNVNIRTIRTNACSVIICTRAHFGQIRAAKHRSL